MPRPHIPTELARDLMDAFAARTGLAGDGPPRRYLWTDAFAVANLLALWRRTGEERWRDLALALVDQVHEVLGRHRPDDPDGRTGRISGLGEEEGAARPTAGGLRIGKPLPERAPSEPPDPRLEWERDGQYFHYLTRWMHALLLVARETGEVRYLTWAAELARVAHRSFTYEPSSGERPGMYWKMSVDLSRPLVASMGQHDPLDGLVTYLEIRAGGDRGGARSASDLSAEIGEAEELCRGRSWVSDDPLGLGGLLTDAWRVADLTARGAYDGAGLLDELLTAAEIGLEAWASADPLALPARQRLAFRELGLAIGLRGLEAIRSRVGEDPDGFPGAGGLWKKVVRLVAHVPVAARIEEFWLEPGNREAESWTGHLDINEVMLATSLLPEGYLGA